MGTWIGGIIPVINEKYEFEIRDKSISNTFFEFSD